MKTKLNLLFILVLLSFMVVAKAQTAEPLDRFDWTVTTQTTGDYGYVEDGSTGMPEDMFDEDHATFLSLTKPGKSFGNGTQEEGVYPSFTVDLQYEQEFNYLLWGHRSTHMYNYLRVFGVDLEGSNDGENFTKINTEGIVWIPNGGGYSGTKTNTESEIYEIQIPQSSYRYLRVTLVKYSDNYVGGEYPEYDDKYLTDGAQLGSTMQIAEFGLMQYDGANFKALEASLKIANSLSPVNYPIGTIAGTYPQDKWDALQNAIYAAEQLIENASEDTEQFEVDAVRKALLDAIDELNGSLILPFKISDENEEHWYQIRDMRNPKNYWTIGGLYLVQGDDIIEYPLGLSITSESDKDDEAQLFKIVKAPEPSKGYYIYSQLVDGLALSVANGTIVEINAEDETVEPVAWQFGKTTVSGIHYTIFIEGNVNAQLNSFVSENIQRVGFYFPGVGVNDPGNNWEFVRYVEEGATDFNELISVLANAMRIIESNYPLGDLENQYSEEKWNAFVQAREMAVEMLAKEGTDEEPSQEEVDTMAALLQIAMDELNASKNPPIILSTEEREVWYTVRDNRNPNSYWFIGESDEEFGDVVYRQLMMRNATALDGVIYTEMLFKFVAPEDENEEGLYIYSKVDPTLAISGVNEIKGFIGLDEFAEGNTWLIETSTSFENSYIIYHLDSDGARGHQINSYAGYTPQHISYYDNTADVGNNWRFESAVETSNKTVKSNDEIKVYVVNRMIVTTHPFEKLNVYSINGQKIDARKQLHPGVYIVNVEGINGAKKIVVK